MHNTQRLGRLMLVDPSSDELLRVLLRLGFPFASSDAGQAAVEALIRYPSTGLQQIDFQAVSAGLDPTVARNAVERLALNTTQCISFLAEGGVAYSRSVDMLIPREFEEPISHLDGLRFSCTGSSQIIDNAVTPVFQVVAPGVQGSLKPFTVAQLRWLASAFRVQIPADISTCKLVPKYQQLGVDTVKMRQQIGMPDDLAEAVKMAELRQDAADRRGKGEVDQQAFLTLGMELFKHRAVYWLREEVKGGVAANRV